MACMGPMYMACTGSMYNTFKYNIKCLQFIVRNVAFDSLSILLVRIYEL